MQRIRTQHWLCGRECTTDVPDGYPFQEGLAITCEPCTDTWWHYPVRGELVSQFALGTVPASTRTGSVHDVASGRPKELVVAPTMRREDPAPALRRRSERGADVYAPAVLRVADDSGLVQRYAVSTVALLALALVLVWFMSGA